MSSLEAASDDEGEWGRLDIASDSVNCFTL